MLQVGVVAAAIYLCLIGAVAWAVYLLVTRPPGGVPLAVGVLIAAISLVDAAFIAGTGAAGAALVVTCVTTATSNTS